MTSSGFFRSGLPYNRLGNGSKPLIVFQGLTFEHKPESAMTLMMYKFLASDYTVYSVLRKPHPPQHYSLGDMANDYAVMIREEFNTPVDILGISTGGSIAFHFAANHPELVHRLIIHSSAHTLNATARQLQLDVAHLAQQGQWIQAWRLLVATIFPHKGVGHWVAQPLIGLSAWLLSLNAPKDPTDLVVTVEAEDKHAFRGRLAEVTAPTLVVGGEDDFFYSPDLFRETAAGIPNATLCLYQKMGHPARGKQFKRDVLAFLRED
jgi:pimeloyl-ACP methyl ester carboxylesterase